MLRVLLDIAPRPKETSSDNTTIIIMGIVVAVLIVAGVAITLAVRKKKAKTAGNADAAEKTNGDMNG